MRSVYLPFNMRRLAARRCQVRLMCHKQKQPASGLPNWVSLRVGQPAVPQGPSSNIALNFNYIHPPRTWLLHRSLATLRFLPTA